MPSTCADELICIQHSCLKLLPGLGREKDRNPFGGLETKKWGWIAGCCLLVGGGIRGLLGVQIIHAVLEFLNIPKQK